MKLVIKESQLKNLLDVIITEQEINIARGGTDLRRQSHSGLTQSYGLPEGGEYENYLYSANIDDVIKQSATKNTQTYLSVFSPSIPYSNEKENYIDYVRVNNGNYIDELKQNDINQQVRKTFDFRPGGTITASHNGLLAIARAMIGLRGKPGALTLQFGVETDKDAGYNERFTEGVIYKSETTFDAKKQIGGLLSLISMVAVKNTNRINTATQGYTKDDDDNTLYNNILKRIKFIIVGNNLFFDPNVIPVDKIINDKDLINRGFINQIKIDIRPLFNALKSIRDNYPNDFVSNADNTIKSYNEEKYKKIYEISNQYLPSILEEMRKIYVNNLPIFAQKYLPEYQRVIMRDLSKLIFPTNYNIADIHKQQMTGRGQKGITPTGEYEKVNKKFN